MGLQITQCRGWENHAVLHKQTILLKHAPSLYGNSSGPAVFPAKCVCVCVCVYSVAFPREGGLLEVQL